MCRQSPALITPCAHHATLSSSASDYHRSNGEDPVDGDDARRAAKVRVELFSHPGCPLIAATRVLVHECLPDLGLDAIVVERVGDYPSPTVAVDGDDVLGGPAPLDGVASCRLTAPGRGQLITALSRRWHE